MCLCQFRAGLKPRRQLWITSGSLILLVTETGGRIPQDPHGPAWEPRTQLESTRTGSGLILAIMCI